MGKEKLLTLDDAKKVISRLIDLSMEKGVPLNGAIVMLGGTALAAHDVRHQSYDVDLFISDFSDEVVLEVEQEFKKIYGDRFRLDVTSVENIWGRVMLRDILDSQDDSVMSCGFQLKRLSVEDLFLVKMDTGRVKDEPDLPLLYAKTTPEKLIDRFNVVVKWYGDRNAVLGYADRFVDLLERFGSCNPKEVIEKLNIARPYKEMLLESRDLNLNGEHDVEPR